MSTIILFFSNPVNSFIAFVALVSIALGWRTWRSDPKNPVNIYFAIPNLMAAVTFFGDLGYRNLDSPFLISLSVRIEYLAVIFLALSFHLFTYYFPYKTFTLSRKYFGAIFVSSAFVFIIAAIPDVLIPNYILAEDRFASLDEFWQIVFGVYMIAIMSLSFRNLALKYKQTTGIWRTRVTQVIVATSAAIGSSILFAEIIPIFYDRSLEWLRSFFVLFLVCYIWYNIFWKPGRVQKAH